MPRFCLVTTLLLSLNWPAMAQVLLRGESQGMAYEVEVLATGLGIPWGMSFVAPDELMFTERQGRVSVLDLRSGRITPQSGVPPVWASGQGGLLDVAVADDYQPGDWIYFTYVKDLNGQGATTLARARRQANRLVAWTDLLVTRSTSPTGQHFGSRIAFDTAGHVFFSVGDRGVRPNAQNLANHAGSVLRLHRDGSVPRDNPFIDKPGALPEIWSYGHRNPQGLAFDRATGRLWLIEHGPRGGDELNRVLPGKNYGWPVISYGKEYWGPVSVGEGTAKPGMEQPVKVYVPSIAPGSLMLYSGTAFPGWQHSLFASALVLTHLNRIIVDADGKAVGEERLLAELNERLRDVIQGPEGYLYISTDSGMILRLKPEAD